MDNRWTRWCKSGHGAQGWLYTALIGDLAVTGFA